MLPGSAQNINKETSKGEILMSDPTEGCPRCRDYDDLKSELEDQKRESVEKQEDALKNCEASKKHLQKRLLQIGVAAVVAGTILGKEFVDKVASFIESFNKVVDVSPGDILSAAVTEQSPEEPPAEKEEDKKKNPPKKSVPVNIPILAGYGRPTGFEIFLGDPYEDTSYLTEALLPKVEMDPLVFSSQLIENFQLTTPPALAFNEWETIPFRETPTTTMMIPAPGSLALLMTSLFVGRRRRR